MQSTEGLFQVYGVGAVAAISDIIAIHKIISSVLVLLSPPYTPLSTFSSLNHSGKGLNVKAVILSSLTRTAMHKPCRH